MTEFMETLNSKDALATKTLYGNHPHWKGEIYLHRNGVLIRPHVDIGTYSLEDRKRIVLDWDRWPTETLRWHENDGLYRDPSKDFTLREVQDSQFNTRNDSTTSMESPLNGGGSKRIKVHIMTCEREPSYIEKTLDQVFRSDIGEFCFGPVTLFADTDNQEFLSEYQSDPNIRIVYLTRHEAEQQSRRPRHGRLCFNYYRCMFIDQEDVDGVLVFEDDVLINAHIMRLLERAIQEAQSHVGPRFVMNVGGKDDFFSDPSRRRGKYFVSYPGPAFYGLMGMYYPKDVTSPCREKLEKGGFRYGEDGAPRLPADLLLAELFEAIPIFNTRYDLVCHVGDASCVSPDSPIRESSRTFSMGLTEWIPNEDMLMTVIIPYRDRATNLSKFVSSIRSHLRHKKYRLVVVEQADSQPFNRGKLFNVGFQLHQMEDAYFCFHDVDLIPESEDCDYGYPITPTHLSAYCSQYDYVLPYDLIFGGVVLFSKEHFVRVNGFSNEYWGWGGEDDDIRKRMYFCGDIQWERRNERYTSLEHTRDNVHCQDRWERINGHDNNEPLLYAWENEGLNSLHFQLEDTAEMDGYTLHRVKLC